MRKLKRIVGYYIVLPLIIPFFVLGCLLFSMIFLFCYLVIVLMYVINILRQKDKGEVWYKFLINEIKHDTLDIKP
jgi:hypothetical protein|tara:strand:+ start:625 stop:849 length:225 start_codon:yes stop_codon:yes gene_type:complete